MSSVYIVCWIVLQTFQTYFCIQANSVDPAQTAPKAPHCLQKWLLKSQADKSLLYFQRYAPDKLFIAKIKKGSNSVNTGDRVMVVAFCYSPHGPLSVYQVSLNYLLLLEICSRQKCDRRVDGRMVGRMNGQSGGYMLSLQGASKKKSVNYNIALCVLCMVICKSYTVIFNWFPHYIVIVLGVWVNTNQFYCYLITQ